MKLQLRHQPERYVTLRSGRVTVGSDPANALALADSSVSDFHAEISREGERVFVADLLTRTGTFVNEERIGTRVELKAWDVLRVGSVELELNDPLVSRPGLWAVEIAAPDGTTSRQELGAVTTIGRDPSCSIALPSDLLSRQHAEIRLVRAHLEVRDTGSANGTFVNGRPVQSAVLHSGDEIRIDPYRIRIVGPGSADAPAGDDRTVLRPLASDEDATELIEPGAAAAHLVEESGLLGGRSIALSNPLEIGRQAGNDLVIDDRSVSKQHARICYREGAWQIEDCGSSNGVLVNGAAVQRAELRPDDEIRLGRATFRFRTGLPRSST